MNQEQLEQELIRDEDMARKRADKPGRVFAYRDTQGKLRIAVGRNLDDKGLSEAEGMILFRNDIAEHLELLDRYLPWWRKMSEARQRAIANMAFNLGVGPSPEQPEGKLLTFKNTLAAMERGDYEAAANGMSASAWARQVGVRATRLIEMMREG